MSKGKAIVAVLKKPRVIAGLATLVAGVVSVFLPDVPVEAVYGVLALGAGLLSPEAKAAVVAAKPKAKAPKA
jgi:hypothetical protein